MWTWMVVSYPGHCSTHWISVFTRKPSSSAARCTLSRYGSSVGIGRIIAEARSAVPSSTCGEKAMMAEALRTRPARIAA